jgi:hypothetical protein
VSEPGFIYLVEMDVYDTDLAINRTLRFSSQRGFVTAPTDTPPHVLYEPVLEQAFEMSRSIYAPGTTQGQSRTGIGEVVLINANGDLDFLVLCVLGGRPLTIRRGPADGTTLAQFPAIFRGTMEQAEFTTTRTTIKLRDNQALLQTSLAREKFAGTNVLPFGLEGTPSDLQAKPKPLVFGRVRNATLPLVNTAQLVYQISARAVRHVDAVYVRGGPLVFQGTYASEAELFNVALAPTLSGYKVWYDTDRAYLRLGASPSAPVTADVTAEASDAQCTAAQLFRAVLHHTGLDDTALLLSDVTALDDRTTAVCGVFVADDTRTAAVLDNIATSVGAWWGENAFGLYRIARLERPSTSPVLTLAANDLIGPLARLATNDPERGLPASRVTIRYARNYTVQVTDVVGSVSDARRSELAQAYREVTLVNEAVAAIYTPPTELTYETLLYDEPDALAEATRRLALRSVQRHRFQVTVKLTDETAAVDLGDSIGLYYQRFLLAITGNEEGQAFVVIGVEPDARAGYVIFTLWGNSLSTRNLVEAGTLDFLVTNDGQYLITNDF